MFVTNIVILFKKNGDVKIDKETVDEVIFRTTKTRYRLIL